MDNDIQETVRTFFKRFPLKHYDGGETVFKPGDQITKIVCIVEGSVSEYDISPSGNEVVVNVFKVGAFFPMSFAINQIPNEYFFETLTPTKAYVAPSADVVAFIKEHPEVMFDLLSRVYRGTDGLLRRMAHLMGGSATTRLLFELLNAVRRYGTYDEKGRAMLRLTENDLAKRSGLSRETVNRTMRNLKDAGLVEVRKAGIVIPDPARLEQTLGSRL
jgi:CRP-like cAMP-binding protein